MTNDTLNEQLLEDLRERTARLPREIDPPREAWAAISAEIRTSGHSPFAGGGPGTLRTERLRFWQKPLFLAAAALLLIAGTSAVTAVLLERRAHAAGLRAAGPLNDGAGTPASLAEFTLVENEYIGTVNRLSAALESDDTQLSPETIGKLKESLRIIDAAILEARRALAEDPANRQLVEMLSVSYNQKLDLLRRTAEMGRS